jgi:uncharacterized protein
METLAWKLGLSRFVRMWIVKTAQASRQGSVVAVWRYPVKSMKGEQLHDSSVTERGLLGDRAYALVDVETGKVVSAKNPRKWGNLFEFRAAFVEPPDDTQTLPAAQITVPDGTNAATNEADIDERLSALVGRSVRLASSAPDTPRIEGYWPDFEWLASPDQGFEVKLPPGTFFDCAVIHLVTTSTLDHLASLSPQSRFDVARFRPNLVIQMTEAVDAFVENDWVGRVLSIGDEVRFQINDPCPRCVMTTLPQGDLPKDPNVLRTIVQHNQGNVGVLAAVLQGGHVKCGDAVFLSE